MRISLFLMLASVSSFGQILFEKGYLIDNDNKRIECLIKNVDWKNNPSKFSYKLNENDAEKQGDIEGVKEFQVLNYHKFIRAEVKIDRSSDAINSLTKDKNPQWSPEKLFLKVLVDSKASLYSYTDSKLIRFFYSVENNPVEQLVYKRFARDGRLIEENNFFKNQLSLYVRCDNTDTNSLTNLKYERRGLEKYFRDFNTCKGETIASKPNTRNGYINLKIAPGINFSSLTAHWLNSPYTYSEFDFDQVIDFRGGLEFEYVFPFNKNKWGLVVEPTYQTLNSKDTHGAKINYSFLEVPIGARHSFFLSKKDTKIFVNGFFVPSFVNDISGAKVDINSALSLSIKNRNCFAIGMGFEIGKVSLEARYYTNKEILDGYANWKSDYKRFSFILGWKVFSSKPKTEH